MGSEDVFHQEHPETNQWMEEGLEPSAARSSALAKLSAISPAGKRPGTARTVLSAQVQALAKRLGLSTEEIAARIPEDTMRRTKYPVRIADDGPGLSFERDEGIVEGPRGLVHR